MLITLIVTPLSAIKLRLLTANAVTAMTTAISVAAAVMVSRVGAAWRRSNQYKKP